MVIHYGVVLMTSVPDTIRFAFVLVQPVLGSDVAKALFVATKVLTTFPSKIAYT